MGLEGKIDGGRLDGKPRKRREDPIDGDIEIPSGIKNWKMRSSNRAS